MTPDVYVKMDDENPEANVVTIMSEKAAVLLKEIMNTIPPQYLEVGCEVTFELPLPEVLGFLEGLTIQTPYGVLTNLLH